MSASQITTSVTVLNSLNGFQAVSLSAMDTASAPTILAGSVLEVSSCFYIWSSLETPNVSSWTAIATASTVYLVCTPSGSAGSQILTSSYSDAAPTWVGSKYGWYASAASNVRAIATMWKSATDGYSNKSIMLPYTTELMLRHKIMPIGAWDMDADADRTFQEAELGLVVANIVDVRAVIYSDDTYDKRYYPLSKAGTWLVFCPVPGGGHALTLGRDSGGFFDAAEYNSTAINRGWMIIDYWA